MLHFVWPCFQRHAYSMGFVFISESSGVCPVGAERKPQRIFSCAWLDVRVYVAPLITLCGHKPMKAISEVMPVAIMEQHNRRKRVAIGHRVSVILHHLFADECADLCARVEDDLVESNAIH